MYIPLFAKIFFTLIAISLIAFFFVPNASLILMVKFLALSLGISIIVALFYPSVRGLKKGDIVIISRGNLPAILGFGRKAITAEDGKLNKEIRVKLSNGREAVGIVESYGGAFSIARVRILYEERISE